jgi:hypothetical protein
MTDLAVPRRPAIATPPRPGSIADSNSASLIDSWPMMAARGKFVKVGSDVNADIGIDRRQGIGNEFIKR